MPAALALPHAAWGGYPEVRSGVPLQFPQDHGAHPEYRTEWWYLTGWMQDQDRRPLGIQITFFRNRPLLQEDNPSAYAPKQLLFAHAAVAEPGVGHLLHDQRAARAGFGLAHVGTATTDVRVDDWSLALDAEGYHARIAAREFEMEAQFKPTQPILLQGANGYSRKGPRPTQASYYYSRPHLATRLTLRTASGRRTISGAAWLDHEWSTEILDPDAAGWDWAGINLDDGSALMAFQVRGKDGRALHAGGTFRRPDGRQTILAPADVRFVPRRRWRSPATGASYPVEADFIVHLPEGVRRFRLKPLFDAQELDGRTAGMPVYWEGAVATEGGRGYLELTGYAGALDL